MPSSNKGRKKKGRRQAIDEDANNSFDDDYSENERIGTRRIKKPKAKSVEVESDYDEEGETKVDKYGHLLGGREYKVPTFELPDTRDKELFMFAKDPAALLGFRDSYVFIKKNPKLVKVDVIDDEKAYLVEHNFLRSTFRTREVSVVTAKSVFKVFGHKVVKKGRRGYDDYLYTEVDDDLPLSEGEGTKEAEKSSSTSWSAEKRNQLTSQQLSIRTDLDPVNDTNWMHHTAIAIQDFNAQVIAYRRDNPHFYDIHTNVHQIPCAKQSLQSPAKKTF